MKCESCGGRLKKESRVCCYCGVTQELDLRQVHFRDLGSNEAMSCPDCATALTVLKLELTPPVEIERCDSCLGLFFNPGELEYLLEVQTSEVIWVDGKEMEEISGAGKLEPVRYRKCPSCSDIMTRTVFGGRSGVVIDVCHTHGIWLSVGELRRISEWWRAGGKVRHQVHQRERLELMRKPAGDSSHGSFPHSGVHSWDVDGPWGKAQLVLAAIGLVMKLMKR